MSAVVMEHHFSYHFTGVFILYIIPFFNRQVVQQHFKLERKNCELFLHRYLVGNCQLKYLLAHLLQVLMVPKVL